MQHVQEPAKLKEAVKALYRKHASGHAPRTPTPAATCSASTPGAYPGP